MPNIDKIRHILDAARTEINRQRPNAAEQLISGIRTDVEILNDQLFSAEFQLTLAEILAAKLDPGAESFFEQAIDGLDRLKHPPFRLRIRAFEHYGDFWTTSRRASVGRRYYEKARLLALESRLEQDAARLQLKLLRIDLELDQDPQLENYRILKRVADRLECTATHQLSVWIQHIGTLESMGKRLRYARNKNLATEAYFESLFKSVSVV